jgi:hypothetical protein
LATPAHVKTRFRHRENPKIRAFIVALTAPGSAKRILSTPPCRSGITPQKVPFNGAEEFIYNLTAVVKTFVKKFLFFLFPAYASRHPPSFWETPGALSMVRLKFNSR